MAKYGVSTDTVEIGGGKFIQVDVTTAIATGRYLEKIEKGTSDNGDMYMEVTVRENDGKTAARRYFEPKIGPFTEDAKALEKSENKLNAVIANMMRIFYGPEYETGNVASFEQYIDKTIADVKKAPNWNKKEMRVKVVLNNDGFPTLPGYAPIFESAEVPLNESKLKLGRYDSVTPDNARPDSDSTSKEDLAKGKEVF